MPRRMLKIIERKSKILKDMSQPMIASVEKTCKPRSNHAIPNANLTDCFQEFVNAITSSLLTEFWNSSWTRLLSANKREAPDVVPTSVVQIQSRNPNPEPNVAPVVAPASSIAGNSISSRKYDEGRKEKSLTIKIDRIVL
ncbi:hypothetical protein Tco_0115419 [Tanacetum coccineum]